MERDKIKINNGDGYVEYWKAYEDLDDKYKALQEKYDYLVQHITDGLKGNKEE
jgi:hypothetical protein